MCFTLFNRNELNLVEILEISLLSSKNCNGNSAINDKKGINFQIYVLLCLQIGGMVCICSLFVSNQDVLHQPSESPDL